LEGSTGVEEGYISGGAAFKIFEGIPANQETEVLRFRFRVRPDVGPTITEIRFLDGAHPPENIKFRNACVALGRTIYPEMADSFVFIDAKVSIGIDIATFLRGDTDGSLEVDQTDAIVLLNHLFIGGSPPHCYDAADANDDGELDISDPIAILESVFLGTRQLPPPTGIPGADPTSDHMGCKVFHSAD